MKPIQKPPPHPPSTTPCPHCSSPTIHTDIPTGDTLCTTCGSVLSSHYLTITPEWVNHDNVDDISKQRCGAPVDESQWRGGLMPTTFGRVPFVKSGNSEENRRLGGIRRRLMKTHALVESMMEKQWKETYDAVVLEKKVRDAKVGRGEEVELNGLSCGGDYEELIGRDNEGKQKQPILTPLRDRKWVVSDALLLNGTLEEVHSHLPREEGWSEVSLEKERKQLFKSLDAGSRSSASKLYVAFGLLYRAVTKLELDRLLGEMAEWLMEYAKKRELKVKGISREGGDDGFSLSLFNYQEVGPKKKTPTSSNGELHRVRQYASLCSAIIYVCAKKNGKGRTLAEICGAFGTARAGVGEGEEPLVRPKYCSKAMQELRIALPSVVAAPVPPVAAANLPDNGATLKSPTYIDAKQESQVLTPVKTESRTSFNEGSTSVVSVSSNSSFGPVVVPSNHNVVNDNEGGANIIESSENEALGDLTSRVASSLNLPPFAISAAAAIAVQCSIDASAPPPVAAKSGRNTPIRPQIRRGYKSNSSMFIKSRVGKRANNSCVVAKKEGSSDVIAAASILLVCLAGQKMQSLAQQAVKNIHDNSSMKEEEIGRNKEEEKPSSIEPLSNPLDDLAKEMSCGNQSLVETTSSIDAQTSIASKPQNNPSKPSSAQSWTAWNQQPPWHREVSQIEQSSGVSSKTIVSYYSNVIHPRRSYFLDVARKRFDTSESELMHPRKRIKTEHTVAESKSSDSSLLQNITAAAPLISIRGL